MAAHQECLLKNGDKPYNKLVYIRFDDHDSSTRDKDAEKFIHTLALIENMMQCIHHDATFNTPGRKRKKFGLSTNRRKPFINCPVIHTERSICYKYTLYHAAQYRCLLYTS